MKCDIRVIYCLFFAAFLLPGCTFAPGMQYSSGALSNQDYQVAGTVNGALAGIEEVELTAKTLALQPDNSPHVPKALLQYQPDEYHLGAFDGIYLVVWDHPEITSPSGSDDALVRTIDASGNLFIPYAGNLHISGLTVSQARKYVSDKLSRYIENPQVDLVISSYGSKRFTVGGEVENPGLKSLTTQPINLLDAIGLAGGFSKNADQTRITLVRDGERYMLNLAGLMQEQSAEITKVFIKAGDVIQVADNTSQQAYLVGEVSHPAAVPFTIHGLTLGEALGRAGGLSVTTSDASAVYVIRSTDIKNGHVARVYHLDASSPASLTLADKFELHPEDFVFVGAAAITRWNRVISQMVPSASLVNTATDTRNDLDDR